MRWQCILCPTCVTVALLLATAALAFPYEEPILSDEDPDSFYKNPSAIQPIRRLGRSPSGPPPAEVVPLPHAQPSNPASDGENSKEGVGIAPRGGVRKRHNSNQFSAFVPRHAIPEDRKEDAEDDGTPDYARSCRYWRDFQRLIDEESRNSNGCCCFSQCIGRKRQASPLDAPPDNGAINGTSPESSSAANLSTEAVAGTATNTSSKSVPVSGGQAPAGAAAAGFTQPSVGFLNSSPAAAQPVTARDSPMTPSGPRRKRDRKGKHKKRRHTSNRRRRQHQAVAKAVQEILQPRAAAAAKRSDHQLPLAVMRDAVHHGPARRKRHILENESQESVYFGGEAEANGFGPSDDDEQKLTNSTAKLKSLQPIRGQFKLRLKRSSPSKKETTLRTGITNQNWPSAEARLGPQASRTSRQTKHFPKKHKNSKKSKRKSDSAPEKDQHESAGDPVLGADMDPDDVGANVGSFPDQPPPVPLKIDDDGQEDRTQCRFCQDAKSQQETNQQYAYSMTNPLKANKGNSKRKTLGYYQVQRKRDGHRHQQQPQMVIPLLPKKAKQYPLSNFKYSISVNKEKKELQHKTKNQVIPFKSQNEQKRVQFYFPAASACGIKWTPAETTTVAPTMIETGNMPAEEIFAAGKQFLSSIQGPMDYHPWIPYLLCPSWSSSGGRNAEENAEPVWFGEPESYGSSLDDSEKEPE